MIRSTDLYFALSGGASNAAPDLSLGGVMSAFTIPSAVFENLLLNVTAAERVAGFTDYICLYLVNYNKVNTMFDMTVSIDIAAAAGTVISIGADPAGPGATATTIANRTTAPFGVTFGTSPINLGDVLPEEGVALWLRRVVTAGATVLQIDSFTLGVTAQEV